jgi:MtaA/CmuA family methyltransferase
LSYSELDRFYDAMKGKPKDRVPVFPLNALWVAANYPGCEFSRVITDPKMLFDAQVWAKESLQYDWLDPHGDPLYIPEAFGCNVRLLDTGPLVDPLPIELNSIEDVEGLPAPDIRDSGRLPVVIETTRLMSEYAKGRIPIAAPFEGPFTTLCRIIEAETVMRMIYKRRNILEALLDKITKFLIAFGQLLVENGANVAFIAEPTASTAMISPKVFNQFVLPRLQKLITALDIPCILHICGDTLPILPLMDKTGARVLSLDQCMDLTRAKTSVNEASLGGNVDPVNALLLGDREKVVNDTLRCLQTGGAGRFVCMTGCATPPHAPQENLKAMVETVTSYWDRQERILTA